MDGENNGRPYEQMDDLGVPLFLDTPIWNFVGNVLEVQLMCHFNIHLHSFPLANFTREMPCYPPNPRLLNSTSTRT